MSGVIASMVGSGGKGGIPITMWFTPANEFCYGCGVYNNYDCSFGVQSGSGPIDWEIRYAANTGQCSSGYTILDSGTFTGANISYVSYGYDNGYTEGFYRVILSNSVSSFDTGWIKVSSVCCYESCYCGWGPGSPNGANYGCYNCSETTYCPACEYDCSCDGVYGYGTGGCDCAPEWDACGWCYPNCPYGQTWCPSWTTCPCGESCEYGDRYCDTNVYGTYYSPPGTC